MKFLISFSLIANLLLYNEVQTENFDSIERSIIKWKNRRNRNTAADNELLDATSKVVEFLLGFKTQVDSDDGNRRELHPIEKGILEYKFMKMKIKSPNYRDQAINYFSSLGEGTQPVGSFLPTTKANINCKDGAGNTPLHIASASGFDNIAKLLLDKQADFNIKNNDAATPLQLAVSYDKGSIVKLLAKHGADINLKNSMDRGPLHWAAIKDLPSVAEILIEIGTDVNARDVDGNTPLHLVAYFSGSMRIAKLLIEKGNAKPYLENNEHVKALDMAKHKGYTDLAEYIDSSTPWYIKLLYWIHYLLQCLCRIFGRRCGRRNQ